MRSFLLAMLLTGCATSYQPRGYNGGYYDGVEPVSDREVSVGFEGNGYTTFEQVQSMAWRRAEEACRERHFTYFRVLDQKNLIDPSAFGHNVVQVRAWCY